MNVRVLVMVRRHVEHLQPGSGVSRHGRHPLCVKPLRSEPLRVTQLWAHLRSGQRHPLPLQMVQPRMEGCKRVRRPGYVGQSDGSVPGKVLHGVGRGVKSIQVGGLDLEAGLHPLAELPLSEVPQLALPEARLSAVQARHVVRQQGVTWPQGNIEGVVAVGGRHDMGSGVFTQGAQGGCIGADVGGHGCYGGGRLLEGGASVTFTHTTVVGGARGSL